MPVKFDKGKSYDWDKIVDGDEFVDGPVFYLLHRRGTEQVTAACLDIEFNPRAPYEIIPAKGPQIKLWADRLCQQGGSFPVFVKELDGKRYFRGHFKVIGQSSDKNEISVRGKQANRTDIYKIIFLSEIAE